jgi:hypothetical protein
MFENFVLFVKTNPVAIAFIAVAVILLVVYFIKKSKVSKFNKVLGDAPLTKEQPKSFPPIDQPDSGGITLAEPDVPEEIGLAMVYPQGDGVGMSKDDSNSFYPTKPGTLLTDHIIPESYAESSLADPTGINGADQGSRIIKIKSTGNQMNFKPTDDALDKSYARAYSDGEVQVGSTLINYAQPINYQDTYNPDDNLLLQTSPGQESDLNNCETTYPKVVKYKDFCITEGDIPYGQVVDGKVNPRLVSRWESFTGDYSREEALQDIDGLLYPTLNVLK